MFIETFLFYKHMTPAGVISLSIDSYLGAASLFATGWDNFLNPDAAPLGLFKKQVFRAWCLVSLKSYVLHLTSL